MTHPYFVGLCIGTCLGVITAAWLLYWYHLQLRLMQDRVYRTQLDSIRKDFQNRFRLWDKCCEELRAESLGEVNRIIKLERRVSDVLEYAKSTNINQRVVWMLQQILDGNIYESTPLPENSTVLELHVQQFNPATIVSDPNVIDGYLDNEDSNG